MVAFIIIQIAFRITKNKLSATDMMCIVEVEINNKKKRIKTLVDSGNMLKDPINGYPVIVVEENAIEDILPKDLIKAVKTIQGGETSGLENEFISKIRLIPFASLGKQNGMLVGIKVEKIKIIFKEKEEYINNVIVGLYNSKMTKENSYNGLVGLDLLNVND